MKITIKTFILLMGYIAASLYQVNAEAATGVRYVDATPACTLTSSCTSPCGSDWSNACSTIKAAVDQLNPYDSTNNPSGTGTGGVIYVAAGTYSFSSNNANYLNFIKPIKIVGAGMGATMLQYNGSTAGAAVRITSTASGSGIEQLSIKPQTNSTPSFGGILIDGASDILISKVWVIGFGNNASYDDPYTSQSVGIKVANNAVNINILNSQITGCNNGIVALNNSSLVIRETVVRDNGYGPSLYTYNSTVNVSNSWFALKSDSASDLKSQYLIYLDSDSATTQTNSQFANTETEWAKGITFAANHIYVGTSGNQFVNHKFVGGAAPSPCPTPYAVDFASGAVGNVVGQYVSSGNGCGDAVMHNSGTNKIWTAY